MVLGEGKSESMLSGSRVNFVQLDRLPLSEDENKIKLENERLMKLGVGVLRKLKTRSFEERDLVLRQNILMEAHNFSAIMADVILNQALGVKPTPIGSPYFETLQRVQKELVDVPELSGHSLPPSLVIHNLLGAVGDMLARIKEKSKSTTEQSHKLSQEEMKYVLREFLIGTNDLSINAINKFFSGNTKIGGILSGGSIYVELVKKIVEKYGDPSISLKTFVVAVDKENKKALFEAGEDDVTTQAVILADDMIDGGGTLLTALWSAGEQFPAATIYSGKGNDQPGGFQNRRDSKYMGHLTSLFQDFADLSDEGRIDEALAVFAQAEQYAAENNVKLQPGWFIRKERIEKQINNGRDEVSE